MQKICPIYAMGELISKTITHEDYDKENTRCDGPMCAWYSDRGKCCAIVGVGAALRRPPIHTGSLANSSEVSYD